MLLDFDLQSVEIVEFGAALLGDGVPQLEVIPSDDGIKVALRQMMIATWSLLQKKAETPKRYEPSEKHADRDYLYLPLDDELCALPRGFGRQQNLGTLGNPEAHLGDIEFYFARFHDTEGRRLLAVRRPSQFKGLLKKSAVINVVHGGLQLIEGPIYPLDRDFDFLIDSAAVHIFRPRQFELACQMNNVILGAAAANAEHIANQIGFVDFTTITAYAQSHSSAARHLASIRSQGFTQNVDRGFLLGHCESIGIDLEEVDGTMTVKEQHVLKFLELLDRRRFNIAFAEGELEFYRSSSRARVNANGQV